jgi:hypothetical protein
MKKYTIILCLCITFITSVATANTEKKSPLLIKFQQDIFAEMIHTHGDKIESEVILDWCGLNELADKIKLSTNELKRAVFNAFVGAGTKNVKATEIARQLSDDDWNVYNHALFSDIHRYKEGIAKGLFYAFPDKSESFCRQSEIKILKIAKNFTH